MAPIVRRAKEADEDEKVVAFRAVCIFDVSQTDGKPLAEFAKVNGDPGEYTERLRGLIAAKGIKLEYSNAIGPDANSSASDYIKLYDRKKETLIESLERIQRTAGEIIRGITPQERAGPISILVQGASRGCSCVSVRPGVRFLSSPYYFRTSFYRTASDLSDRDRFTRSSFRTEFLVEATGSRSLR